MVGDREIDTQERQQQGREGPEKRRARTRGLRNTEEEKHRFQWCGRAVSSGDTAFQSCYCALQTGLFLRCPKWSGLAHLMEIIFAF